MSVPVEKLIKSFKVKNSAKITARKIVRRYIDLKRLKETYLVSEEYLKLLTEEKNANCILKK